MYPNLNSVLLLAAYVIYRVKISGEDCGLNTEIRFSHRNGFGIVPTELINRWEALFQKCDKLGREVFSHALNFAISISVPKTIDAMNVPLSGERTLPEIVEEIEKMRKEFGELGVLKEPPKP